MPNYFSYSSLVYSNIEKFVKDSCGYDGNNDGGSENNNSNGIKKIMMMKDQGSCQSPATCRVHTVYLV